MEISTAKKLGIAAVCLPYLVASGFFYAKMLEVCGTGSLVLTSVAWLVGSAFIFFFLKDFFVEIQFVYEYDRMPYILIIFLLWIFLGAMELLIQKGVMAEACDASSFASLLAWGAGCLVMTMVSQAIPSIYRN